MVSIVEVAACLAVARGPVVNADQSVIIIWDAERQTQHFIRQASFKSDAEDVGFIVPTPSRPQLEESGDAAFSKLEQIIAPRVRTQGMGIPLTCSANTSYARSSVRVIEEKRVAGFDATVLTAANGTDLAAWLRDHGYSYSPEIAAWAHPYVSGGWMMVALKVVKPKDGRSRPDIHASALRLSFKTDRPLFPYREPESSAAAKRLGTSHRLLRIFFIGDGRYSGSLGNGGVWSGYARWSGDITRYRAGLLSSLRLPASTGPARWWLTAFEDHWPYARAAGDLYFTRDSSQPVALNATGPVRYECDVTFTAFLALAAIRPFRRRKK